MKISLKEIERFFAQRIRSRQIGYIPHKLTWEESKVYTNFTKEEYENSSGLYILSNGSLTGLGGWNLFQKALKERCNEEQLK